MRGVVARVHEQTVQQVVDRIPAVLADPDLGALGVGVVLGARHDLVDRQLPQRLQGDQHLDDAGWAVTAVRVLRGDDVAGVDVGDQPRLGGDVPGTGGVPGAAMMPQPDSASPPSGLVGTGSGAGGSPASGTSEESTAGGVASRYGHVAASGAAFGSAAATAGLTTRKRAAASAAARVYPTRNFAIVSAD